MNSSLLSRLYDSGKEISLSIGADDNLFVRGRVVKMREMQPYRNYENTYAFKTVRGQEILILLPSGSRSNGNTISSSHSKAGLSLSMETYFPEVLQETGHFRRTRRKNILGAERV